MALNISKVNFFKGDAKFHHIGLVLGSIADTKIKGFKAVYDPLQRVNVSFADVGGCLIELLEPAGENSPIFNSLKKGVKLMHICLEVDNIEIALKEARSNSFLVIANPVPAVVFGGRKIAWIFSDVWGLFELLESV